MPVLALLHRNKPSNAVPGQSDSLGLRKRECPRSGLEYGHETVLVFDKTGQPIHSCDLTGHDQIDDLFAARPGGLRLEAGSLQALLCPGRRRWRGSSLISTGSDPPAARQDGVGSTGLRA